MKIFNVVSLLIIALSFLACSDDDSSSPPPDNYYIQGFIKNFPVFTGDYFDGTSFNVFDSLADNYIFFKYSDSTKAKDDPSAYSPTLPVCNKDREGWMVRFAPGSYDGAVCCPIKKKYYWLLRSVHQFDAEGVIPCHFFVEGELAQ